MAGKKGKGGSASGPSSSSKGGAGSSGGGGGCGGQPPGGSGRPKPAAVRGGASGRGKRRSGGGGGSVVDFSLAQLLRAFAALGMGGGPPRQRPQLARPSLAGIGLLQRIGELSPGPKIVSGQAIGPSHMVPFDFDMDGPEATSCSRELALSLLSTSLPPEYAGGVNVRCFTEETDPGTRLPVKELHGFTLADGRVEKLSPEEVERCHNADALSGAALEPESSVRYC